MQDAVDEFESLLDNLTEQETQQLNQLLDKIREGKTPSRNVVKTEAALH
jgi:hypothetical protein